jgi:anti-sigma factor RsiW
MDCRIDRADLIAACYGDLPPARRRELDAHLAVCTECRAERKLLARILDAVTPAVVFPRESEIDWRVPVTCQGVRSELSTFLSDELSSSRREDLLAHLARCRGCADESVTISETLGAVRGAFPQEDRVDWDAFARETVRRARGADESPGRPAGRLLSFPSERLRSAWRVAAPLAAALAAATAVAYLAFQGPGQVIPETTVATDPTIQSDPAPVEPAPATQTARRGAAPGESLPVSPATTPGDGPSTAMVGSEELVRRTRVELAKNDAARYLSDSRNLLLSFTELVVPCENENVDVTVEREVSTRLLRRKQYLDRDFQDVEVARARRVADEVESLLSEIALLENCAPPERVREIRDLVAQRQLMMRLEMLTEELGGRGGDRA